MDERNLTPSEIERVIAALKAGKVYYFSWHQEMEERTSFAGGRVQQCFAKIDVVYERGWKGVCSPRHGNTLSMNSSRS